MPHPHVVAERSHAGYVRVLLSRPERRNALDPGMVTALTEVMRDAGDAVLANRAAWEQMLGRGTG
jgi:enoyl-CoA hydratase/carnithine racemase